MTSPPAHSRSLAKKSTTKKTTKKTRKWSQLEVRKKWEKKRKWSQLEVRKKRSQLGVRKKMTWTALLVEVQLRWKMPAR
jgi:hypothetical protein